jgi:GntR family transcriptional repressor for pyruvate dehydrogenase complex
VNKIRHRRLADTIAEHFEQLILEGVLRPGERLASERDLAERLEVSRPSLRDAIDILVKRGLLTTGKTGTMVAEFLAPLTNPLAALLQSNERVTRDYFEYREAIEPRTAGLAALRATEFDREAIRACIDRMEAAHGLEDPTAEAEADADLHVLVYEAAHNLVILHVMRAFAEMLRQDIFYNRKLLYARANVRAALLAQHRVIGEAVLAGDARRAEKAAGDHIRFTYTTLEEIGRDEARVGVALRRIGRAELIAP